MLRTETDASFGLRLGSNECQRLLAKGNAVLSQNRALPRVGFPALLARGKLAHGLANQG